MSRRDERGFTLLEVLVAMGIVALLVSFAVAGYSSQLQQARRQDALNALFSIANAEKQYYMDNQLDPAARTYTTDITALTVGLPVAGGVVHSREGHYDLSVTACADAPITSCFVVAAVARADSPQARDQTCHTLSVDSRSRRTPDVADCW